jgi:hypothetical protein
VYINWKKKEFVITVAVYGPQGSGKTTTWRYLAQGASPPLTNGGDTFGLTLDRVQGKQVILNVRDTPGAPDAATERRIALYGVDGLVFVADSHVSQIDANRQSLYELQANLEGMGKSMYQLPLLFQYNKRDLPDVLPVDELQTLLNARRKFPYQETVASREEGLVEILKQVTDLVLVTVL